MFRFSSDRSRFFERALDHQRHERLGRQRGELFGEGVGGDHLERPGHEKLPHVRARDEFRQQGAHLVYLGKALQDGHEPLVLPLGELEVDDVVVQVVLPITGRHRHELAARRVHQHGPERTDFGGDVDARHGAESNRAPEGGLNGDAAVA